MRKGILLALVVAVGAGALILLPKDKNVEVQSSDARDAFRHAQAIEQQRYYNEKFGFSLELPDEVRTHERLEGWGTITIRFEDEANERGFQIFATPYKEEKISQERFLMDIPSGVRLQEEQIMLAGVPAMAFVSEDAVLGQTREIWFLKDGYLFEITAPVSSEVWMSQILSSWTYE